MTKPRGVETPSKKQKVLVVDENTLEETLSMPMSGQLNPITPTLSSLRLPCAHSRPRAALELREEESPMK